MGRKACIFLSHLFGFESPFLILAKKIIYESSAGISSQLIVSHVIDTEMRHV